MFKKLSIFLDLELKLKTTKDSRLRVIVTDGVFSMDGNVAPLPKIVKLAQKYGAITVVDECHATGFFGKTGRYQILKKNYVFNFYVDVYSI